jgi:hypothetical protein
MADAKQCVGKHATSNLQAYIDDLYNVIELMCSCDLIMISAIVAHSLSKCSAHDATPQCKEDMHTEPIAVIGQQTGGEGSKCIAFLP